MKDYENYQKALKVLEEAHVRDQARGWEHLIIHVEMFKLALHHGDLKEALGQIPRIIVAYPGSRLGIFPKGNVGSTRMGIFEEAKSLPEDHSDTTHP